MIDLHCHILPGLDDGPRTMEDAISMAQIAVADGITTIVATPHAFDGTYNVTPEQRDEVLAAFRQVLSEKKIPLKVLPGSDCHLSEHLIENLRKSPAHTLNGTGKAFLVEWPFDLVPAGFDELVFQAEILDLEPILTHPERHHEVQKRPELIGPWVEKGVRIQVTAGSLLGHFGQSARQTAEKLLRSGWVHAIATDAHDPLGRPPKLCEAMAVAKALAPGCQERDEIQELLGVE